MIWFMLYAAAIAGLLGLWAIFADRMSADLGWPRRVSWMLALIASVVIPACAIMLPQNLANDSVGLLPFSLNLVPDIVRVTPGGATTAPVEGAWYTWFGSDAAETAFVAIWIVGSIGMLAVFAFVAGNIARTLRNAETMQINGRQSIVSDRLGPAVIGFMHPRIVLPA